MSLPTSPGCQCQYCIHASTGVCDQCHSSSCARARWHGFMCNREAEDRHAVTRLHRMKGDPNNLRNHRRK